MTDIFREIDEDLRHERYKRLWAKYQYVIIGLALLIVVGVGGWRGYEYLQSRQAAEAGAAFESAITLSEADKHAEAAAIFQKLTTDGTPAYRQLASVRRAAELAEQDPKAAMAAYQEIVADTRLEPALRELVSLRVAALMINQSNFAGAQKVLQPMDAAGRPYRHSARELLAVAAWQSGDADAFKRVVTTLLTDPETPLSTRSRVETLMAVGVPERKG